MKKRATQYFTKEYLERCKEITPDQALEFVDDFQKLVSEAHEKCQLISLKIQPSLLNAFKTKAKLEGVPYQKQIKQLMKQWVVGESSR